MQRMLVVSVARNGHFSAEAIKETKAKRGRRRRARMGIMSFVGWLFGADAPAPPDATKLDGTTEARLARSLSALPPAERGWITFAQARILFSPKGAKSGLGDSAPTGRTTLGSFAAQHVSAINFFPVENGVYFVPS